MDYSQFLVMRQELSLIAVFVLVFLFDTFASKKSLKFFSLTTCTLFAISTILNILPMTGDAFGGMYVTTPVTSVLKSILCIGAFIVMLQANKWINSEQESVRRGEFYELILITMFGMFLMISARHFLLFVIGLETASLPIAALVAYNKHKYETHEAGAKFLFTAIFSSAIFMLGISYVYGMTGSLYFSDIANTLSHETSTLLVLALAFVISGMGFKLSLVPFHLWTADVYEGAPTSVTSYLSVISKGTAAFAILVILTQVFGSIYADMWEWMMYALIIVTITIGNLFALRQKNMKRFLAFSSISQAGYIMLGVVGNNPMGEAAMIYYILVYIFSNLAAFGVIQAIENYSGKVSMDDYKGLYRTNPRLSFCMMLAMFSLAGIPPFAGFFSKFFIFAGAVNGGSLALYILVFIALLNTVISLYYYLIVVKAMYISQDDCTVPTFRSANTERAGLWICVGGVIALGIVSWFYQYISDTVTAMIALA